MVAVTGHDIQTFDWRQQLPPNSAPGIDEIGALWAPQTLQLTDNAFGQGTLVDNTPISLQPAAAVTGQGKQCSFYDDWYGRVHIIPSAIAVGNLLSAQSQDVEVWNGFDATHLLSSINGSGTEGITLNQPFTAPTSFGALESRTYTLDITTDGPGTIAATYTFNFASGALTLTISGQRLVIFPFVPQIKHKETLAWKTDVLKTYAKEQRLALRTAPRQTWQFDYVLDDEQFSRAKAIAYAWGHRTYGVGVWAESTFVGALSSGITEILFDTAYADYRDDSLILLWESDTYSSAIEISTVLSDRVQLVLPLGASFSNAYVMPLRLGRALSGVQFTRSARPDVTMQAQFLVTENIDLGASVGYEQYRSKDVLLDRTVLVSDLTEKIVRATDIIDNGAGPVEALAQYGYVDRLQTITFSNLSREKRWEMRQWLHRQRGQQKGFWLPSWNRDLILTQDANMGATVLQVAPIGYPTYIGVADVLILLYDGTHEFNRITDSSTDVSGDELLTLENPLSFALTTSTVELICFLSHVRLSTDTIEIQYSYDGATSTAIPVIETPET